jgi:outer membrane protein assembly factor BamB
MRVRWWMVLSLVSSCLTLQAAEWTRFRGPNGAGVSDDAKPPTSWSQSKNLKWKTKLPGPGTSSPVIVGDKVFLTCYSGYGLQDEAGRMEDLKRHMICIDRASGKTVWSKEIAAEMPEDPYRGFLTDHGYASSTPVTDGESIFAFFGKTGAVAFDLAGNQLWKVNVGKESGRMRWGSGASPIVYKNLVIVNAAEESESLRGLDKKTGKEVWKAEASGLASCWSTPVLVDVSGGKTELAVAVPEEIWGLDPETGQFLWYSSANNSNTACASLVTEGGIVYAIGGRMGSSTAVRAGGRGDVSKTHVVWTQRHQGGIGTPILHEGRLYYLSGGMAHCLDAKNGARIYQQRLASAGAGGGRRKTGGGGFGGFGGFGAGGQDYASPILADGKIFAMTRGGTVHVFKAGPKFESIGQNRFADDEGPFNATPAVAGNEMYIRSDKFLYCIAATEEK